MCEARVVLMLLDWSCCDLASDVCVSCAVLQQHHQPWWRGISCKIDEARFGEFYHWRLCFVVCFGDLWGACSADVACLIVFWRCIWRVHIIRRTTTKSPALLARYSLQDWGILTWWVFIIEDFGLQCMYLMREVRATRMSFDLSCSDLASDVCVSCAETQPNQQPWWRGIPCRIDGAWVG